MSESRVTNIAENAGGEAAVPQPASATRKYHVLMELGLGGMAVVEAAVSRGLAGFSKVVVLKRPRREFAAQPEAVSTFLNEARISARMNHPNVVQVNEVYEEDGLPVIVMEYLEGQPFSRLQQRYFEGAGGSLELGLSVLCRALEALEYAHTLTDFDGQPLNLIHRDVSPHNIMVTYDGRVKLLDFGIAKLDTLDGKTKTGLIKGKIEYMSPEQVDGRPLDGRADVFAVGVMLWEVAARKRMWSEQTHAVLKRLVLQDIPDLGSVPDIDPELVRICRKATAAERDDRYPTARALLEDLHRFLEARQGIAPDASIARWISTACADLRTASREQMDKRLAAYSESSTRLREFTGPSSLERTGDVFSESGSRRRDAPDTGAGNGYAMTAEGESRRAAPRWRWALLAAIVPAAAGLWWSGAGGLQPRAEPKPVAPQAAQGPSAAPAPASIRLVLQAAPEAAVLYLDGERLPSNPFSTTRPRDTREHELVVQAEGFEPLTRSLRMENDLELSLSLARSVPADPPEAAAPPAAPTTAARRAPPRRAARSSPKPARPAAAETPPAQPAADCAVPFTFDAAGIKHYRRECIGK